MKKKPTTIPPIQPKPLITVCNAQIEKVNVGITTDGLPDVHLVFYNYKEFPLDLPECKRCFVPRGLGETRGPAERLGEKLFLISWLLDLCSAVSSGVGQIIRVESEGGHIRAIGHAISDKWLGESHGFPKLGFPFYTGVPESKKP